MDITDQQTGDWTFPEYTGSGVPLAEHPFIASNTFHYWNLASRCGACRGENVLCVYLAYVSGSSGRDMTIELLCRDCGRYTVDVYSD